MKAIEKAAASKIQHKLSEETAICAEINRVGGSPPEIRKVRGHTTVCHLWDLMNCFSAFPVWSSSASTVVCVADLL